MTASVVTLTTLYEGGLAEPAVRRNVIAAARALGERTGVEVADVSATDSALSVTIAGDRLVAMGFAAELRRATNAWHHARFGADLWPSG
ncbi:MAG: hypothetical protein RBS39_02735 [Phycisphaerales bacterium]|jgi:hypothetical protein|nr:hypothetical protein [Phycisphaerales bacterium]